MSNQRFLVLEQAIEALAARVEALERATPPKQPTLTLPRSEQERQSGGRATTQRNS